jgi:hypothetical protein
MPDKIVLTDYKNPARGLSFVKGQVIKISQELAEYIDNDSPGTLGDPEPEPVKKTTTRRRKAKTPRKTDGDDDKPSSKKVVTKSKK